MPASDDQVLNKQQSIRSSTSTPHAARPTTDSSSQDIKPPSRTEAPASEGKRALLCGVTYSADPDPKNHLKGSVDDVKRIKKMLTDFGYPDECIRVLIEDDQEMKRNEFSTTTPTKKNIENSLKWLVKGSESGAKLVFFFSGHCYRRHDSENMNTPNNIGSTQSTDHCAYRPRDSENKDTQSTGHDHDLVYLVCTGNDLIPNCYINSTIVRPLEKGVTLYAIVDACYSGSILDLKYPYVDQPSKVRNDNYEPPSEEDQKDASGGLAICLSATNNRETAESNANSDGGKEILGVMTFNLTEMVKKNPNVTYEHILKQFQKLHDERNIERGDRPLQTMSKFRRDYAESRKIEVPMLSYSSREFEVSSQKFLL